MRLEEMRMEMRRKYVYSEGNKSASEFSKIMLPKLVISKFEGTGLDSFRFGTNSRQRYTSRISVL